MIISSIHLLPNDKIVIRMLHVNFVFYQLIRWRQQLLKLRPLKVLLFVYYYLKLYNTFTVSVKTKPAI